MAQLKEPHYMDWKIFASTFATIFVAEMGDKTQLAALAISSESRSPWPVLLGVISALALAGTLGVLAGQVMGGVFKPQVMKWVTGLLFIAIGTWTLFKN